MLRSVKTFPVVLGVLLGTVVVGAALFFTMPRSMPVYTDAETIHASKDIAKIRDILWQPPKQLGDSLSTDADEYEPALSPDGLTLIFVQGRPGEGADLYQTIRTPDGWTDPTPIAELNTEYDELGPAFAPDGNSLYFYSDRPGTLGGYDIWVVEKTDSGWADPRVLGPSVNSVFNDYGPAVSPDGERFYFASNRPRDPAETVIDEHGRWPATVRESFQNLPYDIYHAEVTDRGIGEATINLDLSSAFNDGAPEVSPVNDFVYFASDRPGGEGGFDLYRSRLVEGEFFPVEHLGDGVNTQYNELDPTLGMSGFGLAFSSDRVLGMDADRDYDIYRTESREVYREVEPLAARMSLADFLRVVVPWILLLLLLLGLLALLRKLTTDEKWKARWRRLGLLAKCIIVSGLLHMLLLALLTLWQVSNNLEGLFNTPGGSKVTLVSSSVGGGAISQIRGEIANTVQSETLEVAAESAAMELTYTPQFESAISTDLAPTAVTDQVAAESIEIASAQPVRQMQSESEPPSPTQMSDIQVATPETTRRASVSESRVSAAGIENARQESASQAELQLSLQSSEVLDSSPSMELLDLESTDVSAVNPVSIQTAGAPSRQTQDQIEQLELASDADPVEDLQLPSSQGEQRSSDEVALAASPSIMSPGSSEAAIELGGLAPSPEMSDVAVEIVEEVADLDSELALSSADRSYEVPTLEGIDYGSMNSDLAIPAVTDIEAPNDNQEVAVTAETIEESLSPDGAELEFASSDTDSPIDDALAIRNIELLDETVAVIIMDPDRTAPRESEDQSEMEIGALSLDLELPTEIAMPEQVAIERYFSGVVRNDVTGQPVEGALVRIDSDQGDLVETLTGEDGTFVLEPEFESDFVAVTASRPGFTPHALNLPIAELERGVVREIRLRPIEDNVISLEDEPVVHHLGDNAFGGRINSQFQKESEGVVYQATFELSDRQHEALGDIAAVTLLAKGLQANNTVEINGHRLRQRLNNSPRDGSFGVIVLPFDANWLEEGENLIQIESRVSSGSDHDDFEIVNVQILLTPPEPNQPARRSSRRNTL